MKVYFLCAGISKEMCYFTATGRTAYPTQRNSKLVQKSPGHEWYMKQLTPSLS